VTILAGVPPRDSGVRANRVEAPVAVDTVLGPGAHARRPGVEGTSGNACRTGVGLIALRRSASWGGVDAGAAARPSRPRGAIPSGARPALAVEVERVIAVELDLHRNALTFGQRSLFRLDR